MKTSLNGANSLSQQGLDLQHAEASRHQLLSIAPDLDGPPWNTAVLRPLSATEPRLPRLTLAPGTPPAGADIVWTGAIFVDGALSRAVAYRARS